MFKFIRRFFHAILNRLKDNEEPEPALREGVVIKLRIHPSQVGDCLSHNARVVEPPTRELHLDGTPRLSKGSMYRSWEDIVAEISSNPSGSS